MARVPGRLMLIKIEDTPASGTFSTIAALQTTESAIANPPFDDSDKDTVGGWTKADGTSTLKTHTVSGTGIYDDGGATLAQLAALVNTGGGVANFQLVEGAANGTYEGAYTITEWSTSGGLTEPTQYSLTLQNAGDIAYTP